MKINIKARLRNKTFLISAITLIVSFVYKLLTLFGVVADISENEIIDVLSIGVNLLALLGVVVDPTTTGIFDSDRVMTYYSEYDAQYDEEVTSGE